MLSHFNQRNHSVDDYVLKRKRLHGQLSIDYFLFNAWSENFISSLLRVRAEDRKSWVVRVGVLRIPRLRRPERFRCFPPKNVPAGYTTAKQSRFIHSHSCDCRCLRLPPHNLEVRFIEAIESKSLGD